MSFCYNHVMISSESTSTQSTRPTTLELALPFLIMAVVVILDQLSKRWIEANIPLYSTWAPWPEIASIFQFTHTANTGMAFGLLQGGGWLVSILTIGVIAFISYFNFTTPANHNLLRVALGLIMGGAIGNNLIDRLRIGHVTDFVDMGPWYIFNVADMAISSGVVLMAWYLLFGNQGQDTASANSAPDSSNDANRATD